MIYAKMAEHYSWATPDVVSDMTLWQIDAYINAAMRGSSRKLSLTEAKALEAARGIL